MAQKSFAVIILALLLLAFSFFATTWVVMILAGMAGHFGHWPWLISLSFWDCAPVWMMIILVRMLFK